MPGGRKSSGSTADTGLSRRALLLAGGVATLVGAGGGVAAEFLRRGTPVPGTPRPPSALVAAVVAERERIRALDVALGTLPGQSGVSAELLTAIRANHAAHERALVSLLPATAVVPGSASPPPAVADRSALAAAEAAAGTAAAARALQLSGGAATTLASIAACEATHAELLA